MDHHVQLLVQWLSNPQLLDHEELSACIEALIAESLDKWDSLASEAVQLRADSGVEVDSEQTPLSKVVQRAGIHLVHRVRIRYRRSVDSVPPGTPLGATDRRASGHGGWSLKWGWASAIALAVAAALGASSSTSIAAEMAAEHSEGGPPGMR